eukprot:g15558.t1
MISRCMITRSRFPAQVLIRSFGASQAAQPASVPFVGFEGSERLGAGLSGGLGGPLCGHCSQQSVPRFGVPQVMASRMRMYLAAGVAVLALIAAGDAFLTSPAIPSSQKSVATAYRSTVRGSELKSSKGDSFWKAAASMTLLSLSVARLVGSTAKAPSRRVVSVRCCAAAPLVAAASQVKDRSPRS